MKASREYHVKSIENSLDALNGADCIEYTRLIVVPLLESLGYRMAREASTEVSGPLFILAMDVNKRLTFLEKNL